MPGLSYHYYQTRKMDEMAIQVDVPEFDYAQVDEPLVGVTLGDCLVALKTQLRINNSWLSYVYARHLTGPDGFVRMSFVKPKTLEQALVPYAEYTTYHDHPWPAVLKDLFFQKDPTAKRATTHPKGTVWLPVWYVRKSFIPACVYNCRTLVQEFVSDFKPFPQAVMAHTQPIPTEVSWDFANTRGSIECLHDKRIIPSQGTPYDCTFDTAAGTNLSPSPRMPDRVFPKTNYTSWASFVLDDSQERDPATGLYYRTKITIYPPPEPEVIIE